MTDLGTYHNMDEAYISLFTKVKRMGFKAETDGRKVVEMRPATFQITEPEKALYRGKDRKLNYRFWAIETLCYLAGVGGSKHAELMIAFNSKYESFRRGSQLAEMTQYGPRIYHGLEYTYNEFRRDIFSRRTYLSLWEPGMDLTADGAYCTTGMQFMAQPMSFSSTDYQTSFGLPRLDLLVNMRSNDLNWGTPYDVAAFCAIQVAMAAALGMEVGTYHHSTGSLHYYESGHNGEKPPEFDGNPDYHDLRIPCPTENCGWYAIRDTALTITSSVLEHLRLGNKINDYVLPYYLIPKHMIPYAQHWWQLLTFRRNEEVINR